MWHYVISQGNIVLGRYGSALLSMAQEQARKVERATGFKAYVIQSEKHYFMGEIVKVKITID